MSEETDTPQSLFLHKPEPNHNGRAYPAAPRRPARIRRKQVRAFTQLDHGSGPIQLPFPLHLPVEWDGVVP